jgi:hypothetical protein
MGRYIRGREPKLASKKSPNLSASYNKVGYDPREKDARWEGIYQVYGNKSRLNK